MITPADDNSAISHRPSASFRIRFKHVVVILLLGSACIALWRLFPLSSKDLWTHLKYGEWICANQRLPEREAFCAPQSDAQELIHTQWLTQAAFYQVYRLGSWFAGGNEVNRLAGGVEMLRFLLALLVLARMILLMVAYYRITGSIWWALIALGVSLALTWTNLVELRPHVVGEVFFAGLLMFLSRPIPARAALGIVPLYFVLWANCHASFMGGLGLIALTIVARQLDRRGQGLNQRDSSRAEWTKRWLIVLLISAVAAGLLNPHGLTIYDKILTIDGHPNTALLEDWQPLRLEPAFGWHWFFLGSMLLAVGTHLLSPRGFSTGEMLMLFAFAATGCIQQHMLVWYLMILPWLLAPHWMAICGTVSPMAEATPRKSSTLVAVAAGVVLGGLLVASPIFTWLRTGQPESPAQSLDAQVPWALGIQLKTEPNPEAEPLPRLHQIMQETYPEGRFRGKIMVAPRFGDFFVWLGLPANICSQLYLFPARYWIDRDNIMQCPPGWWETLDWWEVNLIVLGPTDYPNLRRRIEADHGWEVVHRPGPYAEARWGSFEGWVAVRKKPIGN